MKEGAFEDYCKEKNRNFDYYIKKALLEVNHGVPMTKEQLACNSRIIYAVANRLMADDYAMDRVKEIHARIRKKCARELWLSLSEDERKSLTDEQKKYYGEKADTMAKAEIMKELGL